MNWFREKPHWILFGVSWKVTIFVQKRDALLDSFSTQETISVMKAKISHLALKKAF